MGSNLPYQASNSTCTSSGCWDGLRKAKRKTPPWPICWGRGETGASSEETKALALYLHKSIIADEEIPDFRPQGFDDAQRNFSARAETAPWPEMAEGEAAFGGSLAALVEWAPVAPELKDRDTEIVKNSMRFRWKAVRDEFGEVLDAPAVMAAWRAEQAQAVAEEGEEDGEIAAPAN